MTGYTVTPPTAEPFGEFGGPLAELLREMIPAEARRLHHGYRLVPAEDLEQEMWAAALAKRLRLQELFDKGDHGLIRLKLKDAGVKCLREDQRYRRACKAAEGGYSPDDEQFYSVRALRTAMPFYLDGGVAEHPPKGRDISPPSHGDAAEGGTYLVIMIDIDRAFRTIKPFHRDILTRYFSYPQGAGGWTHEEISSALGIHPEALKRRIYRALHSMQNQLGGKDPWRSQK